MHIVYSAAVCSEPLYAHLYADTKVKPAFQAQKYHRLFLEGLAQNAQVDAVCYPPSNASVMTSSKMTFADETEAGVHYHYAKIWRNPILKLLALGTGTFCKSLSLLKKDSVVMVDCLNVTAALAALAASKIKGARCVGIITDLPEFQGGGPLMKLSEFVIRHCTDYVVLTEAMNTYVNKKGKPYVVLEGHADIAMEAKVPSLRQKKTPRICMYAGSIHEIYGIGRLVEGFRLAALPDTYLYVYGTGDYLQKLQSICKEDSRIVYGGMLLPEDVVPKEMEATLLINPRPTDEEYVKYSFPSKTMEYMSTGTPVLTTMLPGLPKEYEPYVNFIREETPEGIADALKAVLSASDEALFQKGNAAREFVLRERNNVVQAKKVLTMLEGNDSQ